MQFLMRANSEYELVLFDRLSSAEQALLEGLGADPDCYGVLRPRDDAQLSYKAVSRDTALLFLTLDRPSVPPQYAVRELGDECDSVIGAMIADGILEVEVDGQMVTGPLAYRSIFGEAIPAAREGVLAALSRRALEYADALEADDARILATRLYAYNRVPLSPRWSRRFSDASAVESYLGFDESQMLRLLERTWFRGPTDGGNTGWIAFRSLRQLSPAGQVYKLYVSPECDAVPEAMLAIVPVLARFDVFHWKVGRDAQGLLRPDKIVIHFNEFGVLQEVAAELRERLTKCPAHGVPFTAEISPSGVLSWGIDPPAERRPGASWQGGGSWRGRICDRLAAALLLANRSHEVRVSPARYAMERLRLEGIDPNTWAPQR